MGPVVPAITPFATANTLQLMQSRVCRHLSPILRWLGVEAMFRSERPRARRHHLAPLR